MLSWRERHSPISQQSCPNSLAPRSSQGLAHAIAVGQESNTATPPPHCPSGSLGTPAPGALTPGRSAGSFCKHYPTVPGEAAACPFPVLGLQGPGSKFHLPGSHQQTCVRGEAGVARVPQRGGISSSRRQARLGVGKTTGTQEGWRWCRATAGRSPSRSLISCTPSGCVLASPAGDRGGRTGLAALPAEVKPY